MYGVQMRVDEVHRAPVLVDASGADGVEDAIVEGSVRNLLPYMKKLPIKRIVHLNNVSASPIRISLSYNTSTHHGLPPGVDSPELASFEVTGIEGVIERYNVSGVVGLRFEADYGGVMRFDKAEAVIEYEVMEEKIVTVKVDGEQGTQIGLLVIVAVGRESSFSYIILLVSFVLISRCACHSEDLNFSLVGENSTNTTADEKVDPDAKPDSQADSEEASTDNTDKASPSEETDTEDNGEKEESEQDGEQKESSKSSDEEPASSEEEKAEEEASKASSSDKPTADDVKSDGSSNENATADKPKTTVKRIMVPKKKLAKVSQGLGGQSGAGSTVVGGGDNLPGERCI